MKNNERKCEIISLSVIRRAWKSDIVSHLALREERFNLNVEEAYYQKAPRKCARQCMCPL